jgi:hypothetical protein
MKHTFDPSSRRTGLAAAAALAFGALSRPRAAEAQDASPALMCCGNGPPDGTKGLGMQVRLTHSAEAGKDRSYEFTNQVTGKENKKSWWVFAVGGRIVADHYFNVLTGANGDLLAFPVSTPVGAATAYRVESDFSLGLIWPAGSTPDFYTRPFAKSEE